MKFEINIGENDYLEVRKEDGKILSAITNVGGKMPYRVRHMPSGTTSVSKWYGPALEAIGWHIFFHVLKEAGRE